MAAQIPQSFRNRSHLSNESLYLYQIRIILWVVLSVGAVGPIQA